MKAITILRDLWRDKAGNSLTEFAIAIPVALLLLFAVVEFGRAVFSQGMMLYAAEEATRWGIVNYDATADEIEAVARESLSLESLQTHAQIDALNPQDPITNVRTVSISIQAPFQFSIPLGNLVPITLSATSNGFEVPPSGGSATPVGPGDES